MRYAHRAIFALLVGLISTALVMSQTCDQLKAEIANLRQTIANEQRALVNCNNQPGTCSTGQIDSHRRAIEVAQQLLDVDEAKLPTACETPQNPQFDHVSLQGIEVVQAIQDMANSVTLVAGKTTWVRVYLTKASGTRTLTGTLQAKRGSTIVSLNPVAPITVDPAEDLTTRRQNWNKSLNFAVPAAMMGVGTTIFTVNSLTDTSAQQKRIICDDCGTPTQVSFSNMPPLVVRLVSLTYPFQSSPTAPSVVLGPRNIDLTLVQSWLGRAYPVAQLIFSRTTAASLNTTGVVATPTGTTGTFTCDQVDAQLLAMKATDLAAGTDARTHYLALVSNQGFWMRGCAPANSTVASGPAGAPTDPRNVPNNVAGDTDASFADFYDGHELAHTFLRDHAGFCNGNDNPANGRIDPLFPYPKGQISDATEKSFAGLDVGDTVNSIPLAVLWGKTTFDIMSYCNQPQWPSAYTSEGIRHQLLIENPGFNTGRIPGPVTRTMLVGPLVHVVATVNLTKHTAAIEFVTPVTRAFPSTAPNSRAELVVRDAAAQEQFRQSVMIQEMTDAQEGEDQVALIDTAIPFREDMAQIQLELDGKLVASYTNVQTTPPPVSGVKIAPQPDGPGTTITWNAAPAAAGKVTFTVQAPSGSNEFLTIAVGLAEPKLTLGADQLKLSELRLTANNGFRSSQPILINLCVGSTDRVTALELEVEKLQTAIDDGEVPSLPRTPQRLAPFLARLRQLRVSLARAQAQLTQCLARNP